MRAMYRVYGREGHRQKASWQKSMKFTTHDGYIIETWCFDRTGTHDYVDIEVSCEYCNASDLYDVMQKQLEDGVFECCTYGNVEKLKYSYYWSSGCPICKTFNNAVANYEDIINNYAVDGPVITYGLPGIFDSFEPVFYGNRFTARKRC